MGTINVESTFPYRTNTSVLYGASFPELVNRILDDITPSPERAYILVSASLQKNHSNVVDKLRQTLGSRLVGERVGISSHTPWNELIDIAEACRKLNPKVLITLGGGSLTDAAKIISLLLCNAPSSDEPYTLEHMDSLCSNTSDATPAEVPTINIPTTLSAGEYSPFAGAVDPRSGHKRSFTHPSLAPRAVLLDPGLARLTPEWVWMSTGVRAVDHCVETLCAQSSSSSSALSDEEALRDLAARGLAKLVTGLLKTKTSPEDTDARLSAMLGARESMAAVCRGVKLGASHGIGHQLGAMGVPHGYTSCVLLPAVCVFNFPANGNLQKRVVDVISTAAQEAGVEMPTEKEEERLGSALRRVFDVLGMPGSLEEVEVAGEDKMWELAEKSLTDRWVKTNPRPLETKEDVMEILRLVERREKGVAM